MPGRSPPAPAGLNPRNSGGQPRGRCQHPKIPHAAIPQAPGLHVPRGCSLCHHRGVTRAPPAWGAQAGREGEWGVPISSSWGSPPRRLLQLSPRYLPRVAAGGGPGHTPLRFGDPPRRIWGRAPARQPKSGKGNVNSQPGPLPAARGMKTRGPGTLLSTIRGFQGTPTFLLKHRQHKLGFQGPQVPSRAQTPQTRSLRIPSCMSLAGWRPRGNPQSRPDTGGPP